MYNELVHAGRIATKHTLAITVLRELGVLPSLAKAATQFRCKRIRRGERFNFVYHYEEDLPNIYLEFCKAARLRLAELHPDRGGDNEQFLIESSNFAMVHRTFERVGVCPKSIYQREYDKERLLVESNQRSRLYQARKRNEAKAQKT